MGMYSNAVRWDFEITPENQKRFAEWLADKDVPSFLKHDEKMPDGTSIRAYSTYESEKKGFVADMEHFNIMNADNTELAEQIAEVFFQGKIIGYWYSGYCEMLREFAQFVTSGYVMLRYETDEAYAIISFKDGDVRIKEVSFSWEHEKMDTIEEFAKIPKLPDEIKLFRSI